MRRRELVQLGSLAILGTLIMAVADLLFLGTALSGEDWLALGVRNMAGKSEGAMTVGTFLAAIGIPLEMVGVWQVARAFGRSAGRLRWVMAGFFFHGLLIGLGLHLSWGYFGASVHASVGAGGGAGFEWLHRLFARWDAIISAILVADLLVGSVLFGVLIVKRPGVMPRWMVVANPIVVFAAVRTVSAISPAPWGGYSQACFPHIAFFLFFSMTTWTLARRSQSSDQSVEAESLQ